MEKGRKARATKRHLSFQPGMGILMKINCRRASGWDQRPEENPGGVTHHKSLRRTENDLPAGTGVDPGVRRSPRLRAGGGGDSSPGETEDLL